MAQHITKARGKRIESVVAENYCPKCPRRTEKLDGPRGTCPSWGDFSARILIVGMSPGEQELREGKPFVGGSGRVLWSIGEEVGLRREDCFIMNVSECWPCDYATNLSGPQIAACAPRFDNEMFASSAEVIITLGEDAFYRVTGIKAPITNIRGYFFAPKDCREIDIKEWTQIGKYKGKKICKDCKAFGAVMRDDGTYGDCPTCQGTTYSRQSGDPKMGWKSRKVTPTLPMHTRWIIPALHPSYIMRDGFRSIVTLKVDLDRAMRALDGDCPEEVVWTNRSPHLDAGNSNTSPKAAAPTAGSPETDPTSLFALPALKSTGSTYGRTGTARRTRQKEGNR